MGELGRRRFLEHALYVGSGLVLGCNTDAESPMRAVEMDAGPRYDAAPRLDASGRDAAFSDAQTLDAGRLDAGHLDAGALDAGGCADPFAGGNALTDADWFGEGARPLDVKVEEGWDARLYSDLSVLEPDQLIVPNERFYIRTEYPDRLDPNAPWRIQVSGLVDNPPIYSMDDLLPLSRAQGVHLLECSGNGRGGSFGLLAAAAWGGVPVTTLFDRLSLRAGATNVVISGFDDHSVPSDGGHSTPGASWNFRLSELQGAGAFLATEMNGVALPRDHGAPVRLFIPGWYGCCAIKWVNSIRFVDSGEEATSQMREFASRTHQNGEPRFARDYIPATMDHAAMPVRIEKWRVGGEIVYRVVGVLWGGDRTTSALAIQFDSARPEPVDVCPVPSTHHTWTLWSHAWRPPRRGTYSVRMRITDPTLRTRRLDSGWYLREIVIDEV